MYTSLIATAIIFLIFATADVYSKQGARTISGDEFKKIMANTFVTAR